MNEVENINVDYRVRKRRGINNKVNNKVAYGKVNGARPTKDNDKK